MAVIYRFSIYDIQLDELIRSRRWGTREGIARIGGVVHEDTGISTFEAAVGTEIPGLTVRDYDPAAKISTQTSNA